MAGMPADPNELRRRFERLGCDDPAGWASSELNEDRPQLASFAFLRRLWPDVINRWKEDDELRREPSARRLLASGAAIEDVRRLARSVAYAAVFDTLYRMDANRDLEAGPDIPGWALQELDTTSTPTGRSIDGLHESLLTLDPSGNEGSDLWS